MPKANLTYDPSLQALERILGEPPTHRILIVDLQSPRDIPDPSTVGGEVRWIHLDEAVLPRGTYLFKDSTETVVMAVRTGQPSAPETSTWDAPDDDPLIRAHSWFSMWWEAAHAVPIAKFAVKDLVVLRSGGQEATIRGRSYSAGRWSYQVRHAGRTTTVTEASLAPFEDDDNPHEWVERAPDGAERFAATLTRAKLQQHLTDTVYSFRASRTIFRPYQFKPVIRLLAAESPRLLIADEVGLGKTIEAGLVWTELAARGQADRVLIVCPSMLVTKWRFEMEDRFGQELEELDSAGLNHFLERVERDRLPKRGQWICSLERLRNWNGLERLAELAPQFDLIIADEAHAFRNVGTRSNDLGALLSAWADALIFLSATPLNLGNDDLFNLLQLIAPGEFDDRHGLEQQLEPNRLLHRIGSSLFEPDIDNSLRLQWLLAVKDLTFGKAVAGRPEYSEVEHLLRKGRLTPADIAETKRLLSALHTLSTVVTRTRKVEVQERKAIRQAERVTVEWTPEEHDLYAAIERWQIDRAMKSGHPVGFATQMPLRLAGSCLPAARDSVLGSHSMLDDYLDPISPGDGDSSPRDLERPPIEVVDAARRLGETDTKFDVFLTELRRVVETGRRVIVFTFSRRALAYLETRLRQAHISLDVLHGGVSGAERQGVMARFRSGDFHVLLASRVASEGLDFEFASAIVNYDLPWNPMEVEQRIGRIDRFGQEEEKILILNFITPETIEGRIIARLHDRIGVFQDSIGELEPILQSRISELQKTAFDFALSEEERLRRTEQQMAAIEEQRHTQDLVESASEYLASTDNAEIDGLERSIVDSGRYVGQMELALCLADWIHRSPGARCSISKDRKQLTVRGNRQLADDVAAVGTAGERSAREVDEVVRRLQQESDIYLCLDQELARTTRAELLTANHPLVRAALRVPGPTQVRFASVAYRGSGSPPGQYFTLVAVASWSGIRASAELWTSTVDMNGSPAPQSIGDGLLAALAQGTLFDGAPDTLGDYVSLLDVALADLRDRQASEEARRLAENEALVESRRISLHETHRRKVGQIERRLETIRSRTHDSPDNNKKAIRLNESQLTAQARRLAEAEQRLNDRLLGQFSVEYLAASIVEVLP